MLVQLGRRAVSEDVVDLLVECHGRIRKFLAMARALADAPPAAPAGEVAATAAQVRRYFAEGFTLHVQDEEVDIAPRLAATSADRLRDEHGAHAHAVGELVALCDELERRPERLPDVAPQLRELAAHVTADLEAHLAFEEATVFPAIRALPADQRTAIRDAMRRRREHGFRAAQGQ